MRYRNGWWMLALAGLVALAMPAARAQAQAPVDDDEAIEDLDDAFTWWGDLDDDMEGSSRTGAEPGSGGGGGHGAMHGGPGGPGAGHAMHPGGHGKGRGGHGMHGRRDGGGRGHARGMARMLHQLDLTEAQKEKIADIHDREMRKSIQARADLRIARLDLHKLLRSENPDRRAIEAQIDKSGAMRTARHKAHVGIMFEVRGLLTAEQKEKLRELHRGGGGMEGHGGLGMGSRKRERSNHPDSPGGAH